MLILNITRKTFENYLNNLRSSSSIFKLTWKTKHFISINLKSKLFTLKTNVFQIEFIGEYKLDKEMWRKDFIQPNI